MITAWIASWVMSTNPGTISTPKPSTIPAKAITAKAIPTKAFPAKAITAKAFPLNRVTILPGLQLDRQKVDLKYLKSLDPIRLLHGFYINAGIKPKAARYGGWETEGIEGHSLGHYLSACALMFAATGDEQLKKNANLIVDELADCQAKHGDGFFGGMPQADRIFSEIKKRDIRSQGFDLNGNWVPWYNIHKTQAGLLDTYQYLGNKKALEVLTKNATWIAETTANLTNEDWQKMLMCEHGGMNESLAALYEITKNPQHLELAEKFYDHRILDPLEKGERKLAGRHGNTNIPKAIGTAKIFEVTNNPKYATVSRNFWTEVVEDHTYSMGGHGMGEYFGEAKKLNQRLSDANAETCNSYNMLKLTDHLFQWSPSTAYGDYTERVQLNHIMTSENLETAGVTYFVPLRMGSRKNYSSPFDDFTCCRGTGMENHAKYGEGTYYHRNNELWINQYTPSVLNWTEQSTVLTQRTNYPLEETSTITLTTNSKRPLILHFRCPGWAQKGMTAEISNDTSNGKSKNQISAKAGEWLTVRTTVNKTATLKLTIPMSLRLEPMPDNPKRVSVLFGPTVLAAQWDQPAKQEPTKQEASKLPSATEERTPVILESPQNLNRWLIKTGPRTWKSRQAILPNDLEFRPFFDIQNERYSVYLDLFTKQEWDQQEANYRAAQAAAAELLARTVDFLQPGEMQSERDHKLEGIDSSPGEWQNRKYRHAFNGGSFSFDLSLDPSTQPDIVFTYWGGDRRTFDVLVDGKFWHTEVLNGTPGNAFVDRRPTLPASLWQGKSKIRITLQAQSKGMAGGLFGVRVLRTTKN